MPDPATATATQLRNIEQATGLTVPAFAAAVAEAGIDGHKAILRFLQDTYGLTYGNANLVATKVRELAAGGPAPADALLDAQYGGAKAAMRPVYDRLVEIARGLGPDVTIVVQKTAVSLRRRKQFAVIAYASSTRIALGLNLGETPPGGRVIETPRAMCSHRVDVATTDAVDDEVRALVAQAYDRA